METENDHSDQQRKPEEIEIELDLSELDITPPPAQRGQAIVLTIPQEPVDVLGSPTVATRLLQGGQDLEERLRQVRQELTGISVENMVVSSREQHHLPLEVYQHLQGFGLVESELVLMTNNAAALTVSVLLHYSRLRQIVNEYEAADKGAGKSTLLRDATQQDRIYRLMLHPQRAHEEIIEVKEKQKKMLEWKREEREELESRLRAAHRGARGVR